MKRLSEVFKALDSRYGRILRRVVPLAIVVAVVAGLFNDPMNTLLIVGGAIGLVVLLATWEVIIPLTILGVAFLGLIAAARWLIRHVF